MYSDRRTAWLPRLLATAVVLLALLVAVTLYGSGKSQGELRAQSAQAIQQTVERSALQCYVVEGVYPPSLSYLEENYGLQINTKDFYVTYDAFASNLPPTVRVVAKE